VDDFLRLENRHTGEILRMRRERDAEGRVVLALDGSLPPRMDGPPPHVHFGQREEGRVKAQAGRTEEAKAVAGRLLAIQPNFTITSFLAPHLSTFRKELIQVVSCGLRTAGLPE